MQTRRTRGFLLAVSVSEPARPTVAPTTPRTRPGSLSRLIPDSCRTSARGLHPERQLAGACAVLLEVLVLPGVFARQAGPGRAALDLEHEAPAVVIVDVHHVGRVGGRQAVVPAEDQQVFVVVVGRAEAEV